MTAQEILNTIESIRPNGCYFGIRTTNEIHEIGDELECSTIWSDDEELDGTELNGTCATGFGYLYFDGEQDDINEIEKALEISSRYDGAHQYLIYGRYGYEAGEDEQEVILSGAEVVAIIR